MTDKLEFVFVEVDKFRKSEEELETDLDKWVFLLKNLSNSLEIAYLGHQFMLKFITAFPQIQERDKTTLEARKILLG